MFPFGWPRFQVKVLKSLSQTFSFCQGHKVDVKFQSQCKYISLKPMSMSVVLGCRTWRGLNIFAGLLIVRVPRTDSFMARCLFLWQHILLFIRFPPLWAPQCCWQIVKQLLLSQLAPTRRDKQRQIKERQFACPARYSHSLSLSEYHYQDWELWLSERIP